MVCPDHDFPINFLLKIIFLLGNFSGPKNQEIVTARGSIIELLRPDDTGKIIVICETPVFAVVRSLLPFRLAGSDCQFDDHLKFLLIPFSVSLVQGPISIILSLALMQARFQFLNMTMRKMTGNPSIVKYLGKLVVVVLSLDSILLLIPKAVLS
jgi:hypothetical protein